MKRVPAPGAKINVTADGFEVDTAHLGFTTSPHEECAVEGAVQLREQNGGDVTVLTLGPSDAAEQLRYAASVGADHGVLIAADSTAWDPQRTAEAILSAVELLEQENGEPFDLILFGNESADSGGFQVGVRVAYGLGRKIVNGVKGIEVMGEVMGDETGEESGSKVRVRRPVDGGYEIYELPQPCVLGIKEGLNLPRYPTMKGRLNSKKLEIRTLDIAAPEGAMSRVRLHRPTEQVSETVILGNGPEAAGPVVDVLAELGVL